MQKPLVRLLPLALVSLIACGASSALAVDGVVLIDQNRALAGNVTPGDTPGFPVTISVSGSYRLSGNLTVPDADTTAIDIAVTVRTVSIDLNGFAIIGPTTCDVSIPPICAPVATGDSIFGGGVGVRSLAADSVIIRNGSIRGVGRYGIFVANAPLTTVEGVHVNHAGRGGIHMGIGNLFNSVVGRNGGTGVVSNQGVIKGNLIERNAGHGVDSSGFFLNVLDNVIMFNSGVAIEFGATGAYGNNILSSNNGGSVSGSGVQVSGNVCNGVPCP
jgi:hypothetical protein